MHIEASSATSDSEPMRVASTKAGRASEIQHIPLIAVGNAATHVDLRPSSRFSVPVLSTKQWLSLMAALTLLVMAGAIFRFGGSSRGGAPVKPVAISNTGPAEPPGSMDDYLKWLGVSRVLGRGWG